MNEAQIKEKINNLFKNHKLTIISTIDSENNKPESAVMAFAESEDLGIIFGTSNQTRKYRNLQKNQNISFVIGWSSETGSVQYEGIARELSDNEAMQYGELLVLKNNQSEKFIIRENQKYFLVRPTWVRLVDTSLETGGVYELLF
jgi:nitroimidazol reductase NimA-like FMN-containing flavoprotein (pyridoxamine 5'-phosphate oxidase superfamily)